MRDIEDLARLVDESQTITLAARFGRHIQPPLAFYLHGDLGTGKTTFARALIHALGYRERVKSPTFGLLETYTVGGLHVLHLDLYRVASPRELEFLAIRDLFAEHTLLLVEWPEKGAGYLPQPDIKLHLDHDGGGRIATFETPSAKGKALAEAVLGRV